MTKASLQTTSEPLEKGRVKVRVEVEQSLGPALQAAYRKWAREIKVPGFEERSRARSSTPRGGRDGARGRPARRDARPLPPSLAAEGIEAIAPPEIEVVHVRPRH